MPTFFHDAEIPAMLQDFGVPIILNGTSGIGLVDYVDAISLKENGIAGVINKAITVAVQTSVFPDLVDNNAVGLAITVDGEDFHVRQRLQQSDGAMTHLLCNN